MMLCSEPTITRWRPDFSKSGQPSPDWIRVSCAGVTIVNALNWIDWTTNPVQLMLCEACGFEGCAPGGYVHASRLGELVILTSPQNDEYDPFAPLARFGAIAFTPEAWTQLREVCPELPAQSAFPPANERAIADSDAFAPVLQGL